jgi:hypothetical protein
MPDVMQKSGNNDLNALAFSFGEVGTLQHMGRHGYLFARVFLVTSAGEDIGQKGDDGVLGQLGHAAAPWASSTASVDNSPSLSA